ncbi:MAG: replicative DNA helicase [Rhodanobacter sp.]
MKIPPNCKDSEMMVLGCMLTNINSLNVSADSLNESDFYYTENKIIFCTLKERYKQDKPCDVHLVSIELKDNDKLKDVGGMSYIAELGMYAGTSANIDEYVEIIKSKSVLRQLHQISQKYENHSLDDSSDAYQLLEDAQRDLFKIGQSSKKTGILLKDYLLGHKDNIPFLKKLDEKREHYQLFGPKQSGITGISTGFIDLDKMINGFNKSNLMILAARPAMGKTALAINIAENVCFSNKKPVGIFSLEMSGEQLMERIITSQSYVESQKIKTGSLNEFEYEKVKDTILMLENHTLLIDDQPDLKINELRARARRMKESHDISLLVIDYLQLISGSGGKKQDRYLEISEISRMLKNIARELDIPVLCLSQLSRKVEERSGHRPVMSDLRESGSIEQDSDIVMFLLRREYYCPTDKPGTAELIVAKNRHGAIGSVELTYRKEIVKFSNNSPLKPEDLPT